ncbi:MAG TPA: hypothetical protein PKZ77_03835, partial [Pseudomonadales bacterium]|nr:hypothetical protein [Pseudomonadales bacterium]
ADQLAKQLCSGSVAHCPGLVLHAGMVQNLEVFAVREWPAERPAYGGSRLILGKHNAARSDQQHRWLRLQRSQRVQRYAEGSTRSIRGQQHHLGQELELCWQRRRGTLLFTEEIEDRGGCGPPLFIVIEDQDPDWFRHHPLIALQAPDGATRRQL